MPAPFLKVAAELTPTRFAEIGRPADGFRRADGAFVALASQFDPLYWPGRALYPGHRLRHRLSLYTGDRTRRLAVCDRARFPINDVAFHPTKPLVAIGTGAYDGGWSFEGELLLWNWETGATANVLGEWREVVRCRFLDEGRLAVLLRPRDEEELEGVDPFDTCVGLVLDDLRDVAETGFRTPDPRLTGLGPLDPASLGFADQGPLRAGRRARFFDTLGPGGEFEERARIWDLLWLDERRIAAVHDNCHAEVWTTGGRREQLVTGEEGHGVQLAATPAGPVVHVSRRGNAHAGTTDRSVLHRLGSDGLTVLREFDHAIVLSTDASGRLLCRDPGDLSRQRRRSDAVLAPDGTVLLDTPLGYYDPFNHYVRLDGGDALYFLRGTPANSHQDKKLCRVTQAGDVESVLDWDTGTTHAMDGVACWGPYGSIIRSYRLYDPRPGEGAKVLERCELATGRTLWSLEIESCVTSLVTVLDGRFVVFALTSGKVGLVRASDGELVLLDRVQADGVPSMLTSLAARDRTVAAGTVDGRVLLYEIG